MLPLRLTAEGLGYSVEWIEESQSINLNKGSQLITLAIGEDSCSLNQTQKPLGAAPVLIGDCTTYVPVSFVTEIIGGYCTGNSDGTLKIVCPSIVTVTETGDGSITVNDPALGEVIVNITDDTKIIANGSEATIEAIEAGMTIAVEYSPEMTASIPPQTAAVTITLENTADEENESVAFSGTITEIDGELVTVGEPSATGSVRLVVTDETVITRGMDKRIYKLDDLEIGMEIEGTHSSIATFSIPPQSVAYTIKIK